MCPIFLSRLHRILIIASVLLAPVVEAAPTWVGNARNNSANGLIGSTQALKVLIESFPAEGATSARIVYTANGGASWQSVGMDDWGKHGTNDWWQKDLGTFSNGTVIRYAIEVIGPGGSLWDTNGGNDYFVTANNATVPVRWMGNTYTYPDYGSIDPGADLWINTETSPIGVATAATIGFTTNDGISWSERAMTKGNPNNGNDTWSVNLGGFPEGTTVRYYLKSTNAAGTVTWDSNTGSDYRVRVNSLLRDVYTDKSRYNPGEVTTIKVDLYNTASAVNGVVNVKVRRLTTDIASFQQSVNLPQWSGQTLDFPWTTPIDDFCGYSIDVDLVIGGQVRDTRSTAADVSSDWTKFPRYGFYSSYYTGEDAAGKARELSKFHINAVQFYDWMWQHDRLVPYWNSQVADTFTQFDGRVQSFNTVKNMVAASKQRNMFTMAYSLIYGDSGNDAAPEHLDWASFTAPYSTTIDKVRVHDATWKLWIMDVTNSAWRTHIFGQFRDSMEKAGFEGIHLDNLGGSWNYKYNSNTGISEQVGFPDFINSARASIRTVNPNARITHNDVAEGYLDEIAQSNADVYYTEVWTRNSYNDVRNVILRGKAAGGGKQVVLAAYINRKSWDEMSDPSNPPLPTYISDASAKLMDACVFANGGFHLELGEWGEMLVNEYFPLRSPRMHAGLKRSMRDYYDFAVRYENFLSFNTLGNLTDGTDEMQIWSGTHALSKYGDSGTIWTTVKLWRDEYDTLSLINLNGVDNQWRNTAGNPTPQNNILVKYYTDKMAQRVLLASPDDGLGRATELAFTEGTDGPGYYVMFTVPSLKVWDLVIVDKTTRIKTDGWPGDWQGIASSNVHAMTVNGGEFIYRGEADDRRAFAGATADSDITEVRVAADEEYLHFLVKMKDITDAGIPAVGIALDTDQNPNDTGSAWIGDASTPSGSIALASAVQYAERQVMFFSVGGQPRIRMWNGSAWYEPNSRTSAISISADNNCIEARISRSDFDLGSPSTVKMTLASFRSSGADAGNDATFDSPDGNNDAVDVMGGQVGVSQNAWQRELSDNSISYHATFLVDTDQIRPVLTFTGHGRHAPPDGQLDALSNVQVQVETFPRGSATGAEVGWRVNGGAWQVQPLSYAGEVSANGLNDLWIRNLGTFAPGAVVDYYFRSVAPDGSSVYATNGGANYQAHIPTDADGDGLPDAWELANSLSIRDATGLNGPTGDLEKDGVSNMIEAALGGNPRVADAQVLPAVLSAGGRLALRFNRATGVPLTMTVQGADAPNGPWTNLARSAGGAQFAPLVAGVVATESGTAATRAVEVRDAFTLSDPTHPRRFLRLQIEP